MQLHMAFYTAHSLESINYGRDRALTQLCLELRDQYLGSVNVLYQVQVLWLCTYKSCNIYIATTLWCPIEGNDVISLLHYYAGETKSIFTLEQNKLCSSTHFKCTFYITIELNYL